jgi:trigger factor
MDEKEKITSSIKRLPQSRIEITASIPAYIFDASRSKAIAHLGEHVELPGFRKGHVSEKVLLSRLSEAAILEEMAEITIGKAYPILIEEHKLDVIGRPEIKISKIAVGNPLEFTIQTDVFPHVELPDYKKIALELNKQKEIALVDDVEVDKKIDEIRKIRAKNAAKEAGKEFDEKAELPELTDEEIKGIGNFEHLLDFKTKLKENILFEKTKASNERHRIALVEGILEKTKIDLPEIFIEQELLRMEDEFAQDISKMGMQLDEYLKQLGKTKDDIKKDWRGEAEKRANIQLITHEINRKESLAPLDSEVEMEVQKLHILYPNAPIERIKSYVDMILSNEKVFQFLERQGEPISEQA